MSSARDEKEQDGREDQRGRVVAEEIWRGSAPRRSQQGEEDVQVGRRAMGITAEPARSPGKSQHHPGKSIERD